MVEVLHREWLNENSNRVYPFEENMTAQPVDDSGNPIPSANVPKSVFLDLVIAVPGVSSLRVYLAQLSIVRNLLSIVIKDTGGQQVTTLTVDIDTHTPYQAYDLIGTANYPDAVGRIVLGRLTDLDTQPVGDRLSEGFYTFTADTALFEACTVRPAIRGVRSLRTLHDGSLSDWLFGHVKLVSGSNIRLTYLPDDNAIQIDAIDGAGFTEDCDCADIGVDNVVQSINGIPMEDVFIVGDGACVEVNTAGNTITIKDLCSEPCCGCPELEHITESLKIVERSLQTLEGYAQQLAVRIETFVTNYSLSLVP